jgi:hypothetical protein
MFAHLDDDALAFLMRQIARDAFQAHAPADRKRIAADYRAALDECAVRAKAAHAVLLARVLG